LLVRDGLEDLATAPVASVCAHLDDRLDIRDPGGDTADGDEMTEVVTTDLTHCQSLDRLLWCGCPGFKDQSVTSSKLRRELIFDDGRVYSSLSGLGKLAVALLPSCHQYVEHVVLECDIIARLWHQLIDRPGKNLNVVFRIRLDGIY
jgi:hypothetical protein